MQARIDAKVEAIAAAGSFALLGISAGMGVQPTPFGMATIEEKMGEVSGNKVDAGARRYGTRLLSTPAPILPPITGPARKRSPRVRLSWRVDMRGPRHCAQQLFPSF